MRPAKAHWLLLSSTLLFPTFAGAAGVPAAGANDPRVGYVTYKKDDVTVVYVGRGTVTRLILADDEQIEVSATGLSADCQNADAQWCIHADVGAHEIWIKPKDGAVHNNLEVRTNRRDYSIELKLAASAKGAPAPKYRVIFRYPVDLPPMSTFMAQSVALPQVDEAATLSDRLEASKPQARNWKYSQSNKGRSSDIAPTMVFDDGRFTYFRFPANREVPAIFYINPAGEEERVNFHMNGELAVVERMGRRFVLRLGKSTVGIWNDAFDLDGVPAANGTTVAGVTREVK